MHNVWLIARREYLERIRTRGFIVTTVLIPVLMAGFLFGTSYMGSKKKSALHIAVVSVDTRFVLDLQSEFQSRESSGIIIEPMNPGPDTRRILNEELAESAIDGYVWIAQPAGSGDSPTYTFTPRSKAHESTKSALESAIGAVLAREDPGAASVSLKVVAPPKHSDEDSAKISVSILFFLMYMVIMLYGMNVARSIIEEKTSRIFEVLLATIRPEEMMAGKIIGVGSVGLTQVGIWLTAGLLLANTSFAANLGGEMVHVSLNATQVFFFFIYFILGYLFYSSIAAALGAMTNSEQELQQLNMFLVMPLAVCFISLSHVLGSPDSHFSRVLALIPPFTPLLMYVRVSLGHPNKSEIVGSIMLTSGCIWAIIWVTSRIYRVGVLMYGKRPNIPEILRWLKYS